MQMCNMFGQSPTGRGYVVVSRLKLEEQRRSTCYQQEPTGGSRSRVLQRGAWQLRWRRRRTRVGRCAVHSASV